MRGMGNARSQDGDQSRHSDSSDIAKAGRAIGVWPDMGRIDPAMGTDLQQV